jgi:hypothetical protein
MVLAYRVGVDHRALIRGAVSEVGDAFGHGERRAALTGHQVGVREGGKSEETQGESSAGFI